MGERSQKVVVRSGAVSLYCDRWGAHTCFLALKDGRSGLERSISSCQYEGDWWQPSFAEGGYLVDFDSQTILIYLCKFDGHDEPGGLDDPDESDLTEGDRDMPGVLRAIEAAWPGWTVEEVPEGVPDFIEYLRVNGVTPAHTAG